MVSVVVTGPEVVEVGAVVVGGGFEVREVRRGAVEVPGDVADGVDGVVTVVEVGVEGGMVEERVGGDGGEEVEETVVASVDTMEGAAVVTVVVTPVVTVV